MGWNLRRGAGAYATDFCTAAGVYSPCRQDKEVRLGKIPDSIGSDRIFGAVQSAFGGCGTDADRGAAAPSAAGGFAGRRLRRCMPHERQRFFHALRGISLMCTVAAAYGVGGIVRPGGMFILLTLCTDMMVRRRETGEAGIALQTALLILLMAYCRHSGKRSREVVPVQICRNGNCIRVNALVDTGNTLRDPISGQQVLVLSAAAAGRLTGLRPEQIRDPLGTLTDQVIPGLRLIPYRAVGTSGAVMLGMQFEDVRIGHKSRRCIVAFAPEGLEEDGGIQALAGGSY